MPRLARVAVPRYGYHVTHRGNRRSRIYFGSRLWAVVRHVELNPVRSGLVNDARDWQCPSARAHCPGTQDSLLPTGGPLSLGKPWSHWLARGIGGLAPMRLRRSTHRQALRWLRFRAGVRTKAEPPAAARETRSKTRNASNSHGGSVCMRCGAVPLASTRKNMVMVRRRRAVNLAAQRLEAMLLRVVESSVC